MNTNQEIGRWMKTWLTDYVDECDEVNATALAEAACAHFNDYEAPPAYEIPEAYFEIAAELATAYEARP